MRQWLKELAIDAVLVTGSEEQERRVEEVCAQELDVPVLLGHELGRGGAPFPPGARIWAVHRQDAGSPAWRAFAGAFDEKYRRPPSRDAAAGYDAVTLVAQAARVAGSLAPDALAAALLARKGAPSVTGTVSFDADGNAVKGPLEFLPVAGADSPRAGSLVAAPPPPDVVPGAAPVPAPAVPAAKGE